MAGSRPARIAIAVDDLDRVTRYLQSVGVRWFDYAGREGKVQGVRLDQVRQTFVQDPDGYWIEVNDALKLAPTLSRP